MEEEGGLVGVKEECEGDREEGRQSTGQELIFLACILSANSFPTWHMSCYSSCQEIRKLGHRKGCPSSMSTLRQRVLKSTVWSETKSPDPSSPSGPTATPSLQQKPQVFIMPLSWPAFHFTSHQCQLGLVWSLVVGLYTSRAQRQKPKLIMNALQPLTKHLPKTLKKGLWDRIYKEYG